MVNAWRSGPAYILIGVDGAGALPQVVGIPAQAHFDDATLQQFVNSKVQRPIKFSYYPSELHGHQVGVIEIPVQPRPVFLRRDFGRLKANVVYLRRGSSTAEAQPDEIAQMGADNSVLKEGDLEVCFARPGTRQLGGAEFNFICQFLRVEDEPEIPDFEEEEPRGPFVLPSLPFRKRNRDFYRNVVTRAKRLDLLRHTALTVTNIGNLPAKATRIEFSLFDPNRVWEFCEESDYDIDTPQPYTGLLSAIQPFTPVNLRNEPSYEIQYLDSVWHLNFDFGHLQPGRTLWPSLAFYVGSRKSGTINLEGRVMSDGLPKASNCNLQITAEVTETRTTWREVVRQFFADNTDRH